MKVLPPDERRTYTDHEDGRRHADRRILEVRVADFDSLRKAGPSSPTISSMRAGTCGSCQAAVQIRRRMRPASPSEAALKKIQAKQTKRNTPAGRFGQSGIRWR